MRHPTNVPREEKPMQATLHPLRRTAAAVGVLALALVLAAGCGGSSGGGSSAAQAAATTVTITEKVGPPDKYSFSPASVQVSKGSSLGIENKTDEDHSISCTPDAGTGTVKINENETKSATFAKAGTFTCSSTEHPEATRSVTVS
jgi:plastocyanin